MLTIPLPKICVTEYPPIHLVPPKYNHIGTLPLFYQMHLLEMPVISYHLLFYQHSEPLHRLEEARFLLELPPARQVERYLHVQARALNIYCIILPLILDAYTIVTKRLQFVSRMSFVHSYLLARLVPPLLVFVDAPIVLSSSHLRWNPFLCHPQSYYLDQVMVFPFQTMIGQGQWTLHCAKDFHCCVFGVDLKQSSSYLNFEMKNYNLSIH